LTKIEARNSAGSVLSLPFQDVSGGYSLRDVLGLDPVKATIVSTSFATADGTQYQSARREARNLILHLGYEPDWVDTTVKELRDNLYKWFMTKKAVNLRFYEDNGLVVDIAGRVESNDSPRFASDPDAKISILCPKPDFVGMTNNVISGSTVSDTSEIAITYAGTSDTGFLFTLNVNRTMPGFSLYMRGEDGIQYEMDFAASLVAGDIVKINTVTLEKYAILTHLGVDSSILYGISPSSPWLNLQPGVNHIRLQNVGSAVPFTIAYTDKYGGL
jgi:hypothetical protein